jgi:hypothetical protein
MDERRAIKALLRPDGTNLGERPMRTERALLIVVLAFAMSPITGQFHARSTLALNQQIASSEKGQTMKINIKVGGKTLPATLADNATARDFAFRSLLETADEGSVRAREVRCFAQGTLRKRSAK